ncbi:MAG TPA: carbonic anhydrase [Dongiaceae bacterium]|nr:carbonic anhydrase [Dongiaceae bacterium]
MVAAAGTELARPSAARAQSSMTPDEALKALMDGNQRYVDGKMTSFEHDLELLHQKTAEKQEPFAAVLACADSRMPVELIFDQTIGHIFVCRVAGNIVTTEMIASMEFGTAVLGAKTIMVLGHGSCGAIDAAIANKAVPGQISALYRSLRPAVIAGGGDLAACTADNAKIQAALLRETSTVLADLIAKGNLSVVAGVYDLASGKVTMV